MDPILNREAASHGVTAKELRGPAFVQPARGVRDTAIAAPHSRPMAVAIRQADALTPSDRPTMWRS